MLKLLIWTKYNISYLLILKCLHGSTSKQLVIPNPEKNRFSHASFFFCNHLVKDYIKIWKSVPSNWDSTWCLVSTDVSRFNNFFFLTTLLTYVENHTKADLMFLCQHTVLPQYFTVNCRSSNKKLQCPLKNKN